MIKLRTSQWQNLAYAVIALRIVSPLLIGINAFWITIFNWILDIIDNPLILNSRVASISGYQYMDKALDTYYLAILWIYSLSWNIPILNFLFIWRVIGEFIALISHDRRMLIAFPNIFEHVFQIIAFGMLVVPSTLPFIMEHLDLIVLIVVLIKIPFEIRIHYFVTDDSYWIRRKIFAKNY